MNRCSDDMRRVSSKSRRSQTGNQCRERRADIGKRVKDIGIR